jgi:hypothetical protein
MIAATRDARSKGAQGVSLYNQLSPAWYAAQHASNCRERIMPPQGPFGQNPACDSKLSATYTSSHPCHASFHRPCRASGMPALHQAAEVCSLAGRLLLGSGSAANQQPTESNDASQDCRQAEGRVAASTQHPPDNLPVVSRPASVLSSSTRSRVTIKCSGMRRATSPGCSAVAATVTSMSRPSRTIVCSRTFCSGAPDS